ncbi:hypothetical protein EDC20_1556, partial [Gluconobacter oxydans]
LKTLSGLTPYEYVCKIWTSEPERFIINPTHQIPGLNTYGGVNATGGMFDLYRVDADVGGFATDDGMIRYRVYGTINGQHTQLSRTGSRRFSISPSFTFGGDGPTTLTLLGNYQYDPENGSYGGVPLIGSLKRASYGYLPRNFYDGDVSAEKFNRRQGAITYILNHRFNDDWSFSTRGRYDDIRWKRLILTGSIRNDWYRSNQTEYFEQSNDRQSASQITWRASGLYHFDFGFSPYISYSTSFQPQSGTVSNDGGTTLRQAHPSIGKQLEGGLKYQIPGTSVLFTAAGFHIEQSNVLVSVANTGYSLQSGLVHSDGFEFEAHAQPFHNLMVTAAVSFQKVRDDSTGKPLIQSGKGNASLFAFYTMPSGPLKGFGFGGGCGIPTRPMVAKRPMAVSGSRNMPCLTPQLLTTSTTCLIPCMAGRSLPVSGTCLTGTILQTASPMAQTGSTVTTESGGTLRPA